MENLPIRHICQVEIRVTNLRTCIDFYRGCFAWNIFETSPSTALIDPGQAPVASLVVTPSPRWPVGVGNYVLVPNCAAAAQYAAVLGGQIFIARTEVPGSGAYTGTYDPFGNELLFWEPLGEFAPKLRGSGENPLIWLEIPVPDLEKGLGYYARLLRWRFSQVPGQADYAITPDSGFSLGTSLIGGSRGARMRGHINYIASADLDATAERIKAHGGTILRERSEIPGEGAFLLFQDPDGVRWGLFQATL
ncbi:MAG TPA: VOC family protein [Pseudomonadota bacterium]|nr:VOC family protein [Pseudomonadota bacterium]